MKYYLIVGEASGDLHASHLMRSLQALDSMADFRFIGGDMMLQVGGTCLKHYKNISYMGFIPVLLHLHIIFKILKECKKDILKWKPDCLILVDFPGFNLKIAKTIHRKTNIPVYYYISPKIWAWKERRIKAIKRDVDQMFSILPFEVSFYKEKHHFPVHYVGNPTVYEVDSFKHFYNDSKDTFCTYNKLSNKPILALLAGSRKQEIKDNLPAMIEAARHFEDYQIVIAGAPSISESFYSMYIKNKDIRVIRKQTYELLTHSTAAIVTSGTATLEAALLNVPQVVCYKTPFPKLIRFAFNHILKVKYISLVNLIANKEIIKELFADSFRVYNIANELYRLLPSHIERKRILEEYKSIRQKLGDEVAPDNTAHLIIKLLREQLCK
nr:lipid-A-disaccharide synthase [uncultured Prevotella sp.]